MFSCEYCEILKNTFFYRAPLVAAPEEHKHQKYHIIPQALYHTFIETLGQLFCCEYCEISKNTLFYRAPLVAAPEEHKHQKYHIIPQALYHTFIETLGQLFCCEYCEISKNTLFYRAPLVAAPEQHKHHKYWLRTHSFLLLLFLTLNFFASWGINSIYPRWRFPFTCFSFQFSLCLVQFIGVSIAK